VHLGYQKKDKNNEQNYSVVMFLTFADLHLQRWRLTHPVHYAGQFKNTLKEINNPCHRDKYLLFLSIK